MLIEISQLKGQAVASLNDEARIGTVDEVVLHPDTGEVVGFWIQLPGWFAGKAALSSRDVVGYEAEAIVVGSSDSLVAPDDVQPFRSVIRRQDHWLGKPVETEAGDSLGKVTDVIVDTDLERLAKLQTQALFGPERMIGREDIVKVTRARIVVHDTLEAATTATATTETAA